MQNVSVSVIDKSQMASLDIEKSLFDLNNRIEAMKSEVDQFDYFVAVSSGVLCGLMDILWVGEFSLDRGRKLADKEVGEFVKRVAKVFGCKDDDLKGSVLFLEKMFPLAADGNTPDFGGGLQHHLREFAHHPTVVGLIFSVLTQFTGRSYGTDKLGNFIVVPVPEQSKQFIGKDIPEKLLRGTVIWFFHLVSIALYDAIYERLGQTMDYEKFGLSLEQTEILYNLELYKTINDMDCTVNPLVKGKIISLKSDWIDEWKEYMSLGFSGFIEKENATLHWFSEEELEEKIKEQNPADIWFRLVLLEAMLFEPYYPLSLEKDKKGNDVPSKKYNELQLPISGYNKSRGDKYLEENFGSIYYQSGYIKRLRKTYEKITREMSEVLKTAITGIVVAAGITIAVVMTAGVFAPTIAVALVGSSFPGLSGAALTSACLAYLGGGAIAAGGLGMAGGTMAIVGGGAILGAGVGIGAGGAVSAVGLMGKKTTISQSAKLMVSVREIFLNDEKDVEYSNIIYEQYVRNIASIEKDLVELKLKENVASKEEKKQLKVQIKNKEESVHVMKIAMKSMNKYNSAFVVGMEVQ